MRQDCFAMPVVIFIHMAKMFNGALHQVFDGFAALPPRQHVVGD
jgi:hypothetical protein